MCIRDSTFNFVSVWWCTSVGDFIRRAWTNGLALTPCVHPSLVFDPEKNGLKDITCDYFSTWLIWHFIQIHHRYAPVYSKSLNQRACAHAVCTPKLGSRSWKERRDRHCSRLLLRLLAITSEHGWFGSSCKSVIEFNQIRHRWFKPVIGSRYKECEARRYLLISKYQEILSYSVSLNVERFLATMYLSTSRDSSLQCIS